MADLKIKILMEAAEKISAPFKRASQSTDTLRGAMKTAADEVRKLEQATANIAGFTRLKREAQANAAALAAAQEKARGMALALEAADGGTKRARAEFARARKEVERLQAAQEANARDTATMRARLAEAGVSTRSLSADQRRLRRDLDSAREAAARQAKALDAAAAKTNALAAARAKMERTMGTRANMAVRGAAGMAAGGGALAAGAPLVTEAGDFQHEMAAYGLVAGKTGAQLEATKAKLMALSGEVNQSARTLGTGLGILVGKGLDPDEAENALAAVGLAATATGAEFEDMSNLAFSVMDNLKIPANELRSAFDIMAKAGDLGGFELKDMANTFPQLTSAAAMLGMTGKESIGTLAAALQVATKGASDTSTAANNFANFLQKAAAPDTVKNFQKKGINIKKALQKGLMAGENPIDTMMRQIGKATGLDFDKEVASAMAGSGGDSAAAAERLAAKFNLGELFGDMQVQNFLAPMLANMGKFREIREQALDSAGTVDKKFAVMMRTYNEQTKGLGIDTKNAMTHIGDALLPVLLPAIGALRSITQGISRFATENPHLTATLVTVGGGLAALVAVGGALSVAIAGLLGPFAMARFALSAIGIGARSSAGGSGALRRELRQLSPAVSASGARISATAAKLRALDAAASSAARSSARLARAQGGIGGFLGGKGKALARGGKALGGIGLALSAVDAGSTLFDGEASASEKGAAGGNLAGGLAGMAAGAAIGSVVPVIGTAVGGMIGGLLGGLGGEWLGGWLFGEKKPAPEIAKDRPAVTVAAPPSAEAQAAAKGGAMVAPVDVGGVSIAVYATPGMDAAELAKQVKAEFDKLTAQARQAARARLYDEED